MAQAPAKSPRDQVINIRASARQRDLIDRAAQVLHKSRSEFILETACREAQDVLLDQTYFELDAEAFDRFMAMLDNPREPTDALRKLLLTPAPWE
jgi:uncharacterized protein (DUF1778 family)